MTDENGRINSQEEYDRELEKFQKDISILTNIPRMKNPFASAEYFLQLIDRAERIGLFSKEHCDKLRKQLYDGIHDADIKERVKEGFEEGKRKLKGKFKFFSK